MAMTKMRHRSLSNTKSKVSITEGDATMTPKKTSLRQRSLETVSEELHTIGYENSYVQEELKYPSVSSDHKYLKMVPETAEAESQYDNQLKSLKNNSSVPRLDLGQ